MTGAGRGREAETALAGRASARLAGRPVALAGFMGAGKSSVGPLLAEALGRPFYDTDGRVEEVAGRTVDSFFPAEEREFRRREAEAVADLLGRGPSVIALGGGALLDAGTLELLRRRSVLVHLDVAWRELRGRIPALVASRPLLRGRPLEEVRRLYLARQETYRQATVRVAIGRRGPAEAAFEVLRALAEEAPA